MKKYGKRLELSIDCIGKTQTDIALSLGISRQQINNIIKDRGNFKIEQLQDFCTLFNVSLDWLLLNKGTMFLPSNDLKRAQNNIVISPEITGRHFQDIQEVNGYTDTQMAQILKISDKRYRELSLGKDFPNIDEQNSTKLNFNVDMDWFLYGEAGQKSPGTIDNQLSGASLPQLTPEQYAKLIKLLDQQ